MADVQPKIRVMFVDDEEDMLRRLREQLSELRLGWEMTFVADGHTALRRMARHKFDVIVSDNNSRHMRGDELMARVHELYPNTGRIILSSEVGRSHLHRLTGSDHFYLAKPARRSVLVAAIEEAFELCSVMRRDGGALDVGDIQDILVEFFAAQIRHQKLRLSEIPVKIRPLLPSEVLDSIAPYYDRPQPTAGGAAEPARDTGGDDNWLDLTEPD